MKRRRWWMEWRVNLRDPSDSDWSVIGPLDEELFDRDSITIYLNGIAQLAEPENAVAARKWFIRFGADWIHPRGYEWMVDADKFRAEFEEFRNLHWLHGRFFVRPELFGISNISLYLSPDNPRESLMLHKAPPEIRGSLNHFQQQNGDAETAFIIMRFSETAAHGKIVDAIRQATDSLGVRALRADDRTYHDDLFYNVLTYLYGCYFGIAVFERLETDEFNPNVALEVGYMLALGKPVCLLKDRTLRTLQTDLVGKLYVGFDPQDPGGTIPSQLEKWMKDKGLV